MSLFRSKKDKDLAYDLTEFVRDFDTYQFNDCGSFDDNYRDTVAVLSSGNREPIIGYLEDAIGSGSLDSDDKKRARCLLKRVKSLGR